MPLLVSWNNPRVDLLARELVSHCLCQLSCNLAPFAFDVRETYLLLQSIVLLLFLLVEIRHRWGHFVREHRICRDRCLLERTLALIITMAWQRREVVLGNHLTQSKLSRCSSWEGWDRWYCRQILDLFPKFLINFLTRFLDIWRWVAPILILLCLLVLSWLTKLFVIKRLLKVFTGDKRFVWLLLSGSYCFIESWLFRWAHLRFYLFESFWDHAHCFLKFRDICWGKSILLELVKCDLILLLCRH